MRLAGIDGRLCVVSVLAATASAQLVALDLGSGASWTATSANGSVSIPATVPGQIHTDLIAAGIISDNPYYRFNDLLLRWVAYDNWTYVGTWKMESIPESSFLRFDGIDTVATISVNKHEVASVDNMFRQWEIDTSDYLVSGTNTVEVKFTSAVTYAAQQYADYVNMPPDGIPPTCPPAVQQGLCHVNMIRKEPCSFSWDWGPAYAPQGLWRNVSLLYTPMSMDTLGVTTVVKQDGQGAPSATEGCAAGVSVRYMQVDSSPVNATSTASDAMTSGGIINPGVILKDGMQWQANVRLQMDVAASAPVSGVVKCSIVGPNGTTVGVFSGPVTLAPGIDGDGPSTHFSFETSKGVDLWWPHEYGAHPLYTLTTTLTACGATATATQRIGFRTVELVQDPAPAGASFFFRVNGLPVYIKGANWVPADAFESRVTRTYLETLFDSYAAGHFNMLRNWGGGVFQSDTWYDLCDEYGFLVWEEFMHACSLYPNSTAFLDNVAAEVAHQVQRLSSHTSIALWAGNNENEIAMADNWYGVEGVNFEPWYVPMYADLYWRTILPTVYAHDETRPTLGSSPSNGNETVDVPVDKNPGAWERGDVHYYNYAADCWDVTTYPRPRFASEFGVQSWPSFRTMSRVTDESLGDWSYNSSVMVHRNHHPGGQGQMWVQAGLHYPYPSTTNETDAYEQALWLTQVSQAYCIRQEAEHYRRIRSEGNTTSGGYNMGTLYWQANDIWEGASWSSIEYGGKWKVLHHFTTHFYAPVLVSPFLSGGGLDVYVVSDLVDLSAGSLTLTTHSYSDGVVDTWSVPTQSVGAGEAASVYSTPTSTLQTGTCSELSACVLEVELSVGTSNTTSSNWLFLGSPLDTTLPDPGLSIEPAVDGRMGVTVTASNAAAAFVWLEADGWSGRWEDNGFFLPSGRTVTVSFVCFGDDGGSTTDAVNGEVPSSCGIAADGPLVEATRVWSLYDLQ